MGWVTKQLGTVASTGGFCTSSERGASAGGGSVSGDTDRTRVGNGAIGGDDGRGANDPVKLVRRASKPSGVGGGALQKLVFTSMSATPK